MKHLTRGKFLKKGLFAILGLVSIDALWFEKYVIEWNYFDISKTRKNKIRIIQISDLHINDLKHFHNSIAKKINTKKPNVIFITGDTVDNSENLSYLNQFLKLIDKNIPKYAILGNWEYWGKVNIKRLKNIYLQNNCELLINQNKTISIYNREISIIGIDDFVGGNANFKIAIKNLKKTTTNIVLSHCPAYTNKIALEKEHVDINLILSGHTHGGQITLLGFAPYKPQGSGNFLKGWYKISNIKMYVSKGIGTSVLPIRFGARAEIVEMLI